MTFRNFNEALNYHINSGDLVIDNVPISALEAYGEIVAPDSLPDSLTAEELITWSDNAWIDYVGAFDSPVAFAENRTAELTDVSFLGKYIDHQKMWDEYYSNEYIFVRGFIFSK